MTGPAAIHGVGTSRSPVPGVEVLVPHGNFWSALDEQLTELESARSVADVLRILAQSRNPLGPGASTAPGHCADSGGTRSMEAVLDEAGWEYLWRASSVHYCLRAPDGSGAITYVEGDVFEGSRPPLPDSPGAT
uniref:hypothetical protein n=1 Tax=Amycolatopsis sp. CA-096443 TaxID=3239919 RepID=UPI003F49A22F